MTHSLISKGNKPTVIIILGMHRSGTSCLAGTLEQCGVFLGEVKTSSPFNKKGNRENPTIFKFQELILQESGGSWSEPPEDIIWKAEYDEKIVELLGLFKGESLWGFKDPRTLFTIDNWLKNLEENYTVKLVGSYRHPFKVAQSLFKRNGFPIEKGLNVWGCYNRRLIDICETQNVRLVNFDLPRSLYFKKIKGLSDFLSLPKSIINAFYDEDLVTVSDENLNDFSVLPAHIYSIYEKLMSYE